MTVDDCPFCQIAKHDLPAAIVYEDDLVIAIMDSRPIRPGHLLVNPRQHYPYYEDVPTETANRLFHVAQRLSRVLKALYKVRQVAFLFAGSDIAHTHGHVVPMHDKTDVTSRLYIAEGQLTFRAVPEAALETRSATASQISAALARFP